MVVVNHLFLFLRINFGGRRDSCESRLPPIKAIYFPTAPLFAFRAYQSVLQINLPFCVFYEL